MINSSGEFDSGDHSLWRSTYSFSIFRCRLIKKNREREERRRDATAAQWLVMATVATPKQRWRQ
ncbi:hypothetical protein ACS0TY_003874 [Phlomoides rotata]